VAKTSNESEMRPLAPPAGGQLEEAPNNSAARLGGGGNPAASLILPGQRDSRVVEFEIAVLSFFLEAADILGIPKSVAAIYGTCFASERPLSFADIDERLDISKGSISQGLRVLNEIGALKNVGTHDRREYFVPDLALRKLAVHFIEERLGKQLEAGQERLVAIAAAIPEGDGLPHEMLKARVKALRMWHTKSRELLPLVKAFLKLS
jgi:HTH-type transcriptional regulator, glycine betaine synthesis regulator